ncbi:MAG: hypothetical protein WA252_17245 [Candidatus Sulfotelmatobacter sp.]
MVVGVSKAVTLLTPGGWPIRLILDFDRITTEEAAPLVAVFDEWVPRTSMDFPRRAYHAERSIFDGRPYV